jgi:hypothetical protein
VDTGFRNRSCSNNELKRDDDSKKSHHALAVGRSAAIAAALSLAAGIAPAIFDALRVIPALARAVRNRDRREIPGRGDVGAEQGQQCGCEDGLTHRNFSPSCSTSDRTVAAVRSIGKSPANAKDADDETILSRTPEVPFAGTLLILSRLADRIASRRRDGLQRWQGSALISMARVVSRTRRIVSAGEGGICRT